MEAGILITGEQIRVIARKEQLAAGVVEKEYALSWLLKGFYSRNSSLKNDFVLKGGTAIRKVYFPETWRFSEDLDFTMVGRKESERIRESMQKVLRSLLQVSGLNYSMDSFHPAEGAILANVQFMGPLNFTNRIKHDITLKEKMVMKPIRRHIRTIYPDVPRFNILAYPLNEILAEKNRSIIQRGYSRDYYDVCNLSKKGKFKDSQIKKLLIRKCEMNKIKYQPRLMFNKRRLDAARSFWETGLRYLTKELPDFGRVVSNLKAALEFLQE